MKNKCNTLIRKKKKNVSKMLVKIKMQQARRFGMLSGQSLQTKGHKK